MVQPTPKKFPHFIIIYVMFSLVYSYFVMESALFASLCVGVSHFCQLATAMPLGKTHCCHHHCDRISEFKLRVMDRHGDCARVVAAAQLKAVNIAGVKSPDMYGLFSEQKRILPMI